MWKPEHRRAAERRGLRYPSDLTRRRMGAGRAADPAGQARRASARGECSRGSQRDLLRALDGLPMAGAAEGPAAEEHGAFLLHAVGLGRHAGAHPPRALRRDARAGGPRSQPDGGDHRQPKRQGGSKRGSALDPQGFDAGKKVTGRKRHILVDTLGLLLSVVVHPADVQDRDGARWSSIARTRRLFPFIERIFADAGYQGPKMASGRRRDRQLEVRDRQAQRTAPLRRAAQALDRRANARLDQPQSPPRARLRALRPNRRRLRPPRNDPHHAPTLDQPNSLLLNPNFLDRLFHVQRP